MIVGEGNILSTYMVWYGMVVVGLSEEGGVVNVILLLNLSVCFRDVFFFI